MGKIKIVAPSCAFMNHTRWLILLDNKFPIRTKIVTLKSLQHKIKFILDKVYTDSRTWHNWLEHEFKYHFLLDETSDCILIHHPDEIVPDDKIILCKIDPKIRWRMYLKFCTRIDLCVESYQEFVSITNKHLEKDENMVKDQKDLLKIDNSILWKDYLDENYYQKLINFLGIDNNYESANLIHKKWYNIHRSAETQFLADLNEIFS